MNKCYTYDNGKINICTDNTLLPAIPFVDNIGDILEYENEIEYLTGVLVRDEKALKEKINSRSYRTKDAITVLKSMGVISIGSAATIYLLGYLPFMLFEDTKVIANVCIGTGAALGSILSIYSLISRPSNQDVNGYEEKVLYERETLEFLKNELEVLTSNPTTKRLGLMDDTKVYQVNSDSSIKYYNDAIRLRYEFGYNPDKFITWLDDGSLAQRLHDEGIEDENIMEFMSFVQLRKEQRNLKGENTYELKK